MGQRDLFSVKDVERGSLEESFLSMTADELAAEIRRHDELYFLKNQAEISDLLYDRLKERLAELAPRHPIFDEVAPLGVEAKILHTSPMLSLEKAYDLSKIEAWYEKFEGAVVGSPKIDGLACSLRYNERGELYLAATRGNGVRGEDITGNVRFVHNIPLTIEFPNLEVRGEIYMPLSVFEGFRDQYSSARNLAAGGIKLKNFEETARYGLRFFAYDVLGFSVETEVEKNALLRSLSFVPAPMRLLSKGDFESYCESQVRERDSLDYETDGLVFKANLISQQELLGNTSHHPRYAIAFKYQGDSGLSRLIQVEWQLGRSGAITPLALVEPVVLSGATVRKASLHNLGRMEALNLGVGDRLEMSRRGEVIPHVERVVEHLGGKIEIPEKCPACGSATLRRNDFLYCSSPQTCLGGRLARLVYFAKVMNLEGFGEKIISQLMDLELLHDASDFYGLRVEDLMRLGKGSSQSGRSKSSKLAENLYASLQGGRRVGLAQFLESLGIAGLGRSQSLVLAERFVTLEAVLGGELEDFLQVSGFGEVTAEAVVMGLLQQRDLIADLRSHLEIEDFRAQSLDGVESRFPYVGKSFLFTGTLTSMPRKEAEKAMEALGAKVAGSVTKDLAVLVATSNKSSKWERAQKLNASGAEIELWDEARFLAFLEEYRS